MKKGEESVKLLYFFLLLPVIELILILKSGLISIMRIAEMTSWSRNSCGEKAISACLVPIRIEDKRKLLHARRLTLATQVRAMVARTPMLMSLQELFLYARKEEDM
jgi:hypothetical protein